MTSSSPAPEADRQQDALLTAALVLVGQGATADELARRFAAVESVGRPEGAARLLARLAGLGLVLVANAEGEQDRYELTVLGQEHAAATLGGRTDTMLRLEELERLRTDLLSTIAHELRTPLTAVRTCVGLLLDPTVRPDPDARSQLLRNIEQSAERMQRLVADVLDLTRFRSGGIRLQLRRFDACALARAAAVAMAPLLGARGQSLEPALPDGRVWVYGDRRRLEQALLNLLSNAQKFSPAGAAVRLSVAVRGDQVAWSVADRGPGIAPEDQRRLFERFFTVASDTSADGGGTGLGLPIARAIALAHGGAIEVESAVGGGSTFTLRVPASGPVGAGEL
jgi:signal transduction histidine kinase